MVGDLPLALVRRLPLTMISFHLLQTKLAWQVYLKLRSLNIFSSNSGGKMLIIVGIERFFIMPHNLSFWLLSCPEKIASANVLKLVKASLKSLEFILRVAIVKSEMLFTPEVKLFDLFSISCCECVLKRKRK